ncbi:MAG: hemolysin family protein, partial [Nitriliruptorales bacterium]|nr:hemolysin family protein [Nitriliruptorales bacterium]
MMGMSTLLAAAAGDAAHAEFSWTALLLGVFLLVANGFFVAAEIALLAARRVRVEELADSGDPRAVRALEALRELSITFSGAQLGITMASLLLGMIAEPAVAALFDGWLEAAGVGGASRPIIAFALALSLVVFLHMVVGEMAPKNLALSRAEEVSLRVSRTFGWFVTAFRPLIIALNGAANVLIRAVGVEPVDEHNLVHTPDELLLALRESRRHGTLEAHDARVLTAALRLSEIHAGDAMTPRVDLEAVADSASPQELLALAAETGFTRFLVYHEDIDDVVGLVHVKDVLMRAEDELEGMTVADLLRPVPAVPGSRDLDELLREMQAGRAHAALVVDEYGGTAGIITLEDVIEELVGDIADEFDPSPPPVRRLGERRWLVQGTLRRDELTQLVGMELPDGEAETVSGYLTEELGRLVR